MNDSDILVQRGRPWFSWAIVAGVAVIAASGAGVYFSVVGGQRDVLEQLAETRVVATEATKALVVIADDIRAVRDDVDKALADPWKATDMRFMWAEIGVFWSEFQRLNPTVSVPQWPPVRRATDDGAR